MSKLRCPNMNHGRLNAPIRHCPNCGEKINKLVNGQCNQAKHASLRKSGLKFCTECGGAL